ncbi:MAG TPA: DEAD/DEAH box helicase, partial [Myxococcaceae bacterium]|nr:DEAD/DEAH box helicase [Myxococcaceae bacterium]
ALSGTPLENHLGELWGLFAVVFPGLLGSWEAFRSRFATPIEKGLDPTAAPALARVLQPFLLRRTKAQVEAQLPARTDVRVPVVLSPAEWTLYEDARLAALSDLEARASVLRDQERRVEVLAALTRLRLLASHPRLYDPRSKLQSAKLERFMELVRELRAEGHRALVFSQFTSHLALVREVLDAEGVGYEYLDGSTPHGARAERVRAFQEGTAPLFLISLKAGGFGLNLTAATSVIHLDPWWNPAVEDQASDRAHRIGQARPVTVYRLVARGTIEEQMLALHAHKRALVEGVLEGKDAAARLSTRELLGMLAQGVAPSVEGIPMPATRH